MERIERLVLGAITDIAVRLAGYLEREVGCQAAE
jgi:hypothetical protein